MVIGGANLIAAATEVVAKLALRIRLDFRFSVTCAGEKDRRRSSLRALNALGVVVTYFGGELRQTKRLRHVCCQPCGRRHPHGAAVAVALVGLRVILIEPAAKMDAIAPVRVGAAQSLYLVHQCRFDGGIVLPASAEQRLCHRQRYHRVVGEVGTAAEQRKILGLVVVAVELVGAAHDVTQNRSVHISYLPLFCTSSSMRRFQSALRGRAARTLHTASLMTS